MYTTLISVNHLKGLCIVILFLGIQRQSKINNDLVRSDQDKHRVPLISFKDTMTVWINQCLTSTVSLLVKLSQEEFDSKPFGTLNPLNNGGLIQIYKLLHVEASS